jgi:hypothetical protein
MLYDIEIIHDPARHRLVSIERQESGKVVITNTSTETAAILKMFVLYNDGTWEEA